MKSLQDVGTCRTSAGHVVQIEILNNQVSVARHLTTFSPTCCRYQSPFTPNSPEALLRLIPHVAIIYASWGKCKGGRQKAMYRLQARSTRT